MKDLIISIDWLQLYCDMVKLEYSEDYKVDIKDYGTKHFTILEDIYWQGSLFAQVQRKPRSGILKESSGIIKISNSILYSIHAESIITEFLMQCSISIINITRIDIAVDFRTFKHGLHPSTLIRNFMTEKFLRNGRGKYTIIGDQRNVAEVAYLKFGTRASDVTVYLYNKTLEMFQKVHKEYIAETWRDLKGSPLADIWRLEFSLKAKATTFIDESTGELQQIDLSFLSNNSLKTRITSALVTRYFEFKRNDGQRNKTRMKSVDLFNFDNVGLTNRYFPRGTDIYKRDKILMKNIYTLDKEHRNVPEYIQEATDQILDFMRGSDFLDNYYKKNETEWSKVPFRV